MAGFEISAFGAPLRTEVFRALTGCVEDDLVPTHLMSDAILAAWSKCKATPNDTFIKPTPPHMRVILQWWGTDYRRDQDPNYWVKRAEEKMVAPIVYSDTRFPNEAKAVVEHNGVIWRIERPPQEDSNDGIKGHSSESVAHTILADLTLKNDTVLEIFAQRVRGALLRSFGEYYAIAK